jgi:hypothetical protein
MCTGNWTKLPWNELSWAAQRFKLQHKQESRCHIHLEATHILAIVQERVEVPHMLQGHMCINCTQERFVTIVFNRVLVVCGSSGNRSEWTVPMHVQYTTCSDHGHAGYQHHRHAVSGSLENCFHACHPCMLAVLMASVTMVCAYIVCFFYCASAISATHCMPVLLMTSMNVSRLKHGVCKMKHATVRVCVCVCARACAFR